MLKKICFIFHSRHLTPEQRNIENALIMFSVKDYDLLGYNNQYIGEAFVNFKDITDTLADICSLPQIHLPLSRPTELSEFVCTRILIVTSTFHFYDTNSFQTLVVD